MLRDCQLWDVSAGGGSCQPNQAVELLSWGLALLRHLVHGPLTQRALPHTPPPPYLDTGGNGKQNTLWRLVGSHLPLL